GDLDPRPAARWTGEAAPGLHADLHLQRESDGSFRLDLNRGLWPEVRIDKAVALLSQDSRQPGEVRQHLRRKLEEARWLVEALAQRQTTLLRVARAVFHAQAAFLEQGTGRLIPLSMQAIAEDLGLATSTISRSVAGKYVDTPHGILPLRAFFQAQAGGTSREGLRGMVRTLIADEDPAAPLSDEALVAALVQAGHPVARRTVAKYRGELGIKSSYQRVQHA
ncbi:MAG TPA: hypothetical protein P5218_00290, partial [Planctomycetota bacterium]|nr:hypothetical protein [Planctomycetota bacterium]